MNPLSIVSVASPHPTPQFASVSSYMASTMDQWGHLIATVQQDLFGAYQALIAQEFSYFQQQADRFLGINPTLPSSSLNTTVTQPKSSSDSGSGRGSGSGSGSGSGATASAHSDPNQPVNKSSQQSTSGTGSGSNATTTSSHVNASQQRSMKMQPMTSGSGTGSGYGSGSATVSGQVWLDNNGDGYKDNGESGLPGMIVYLYDYGNLVDSATTDGNGYYQFLDQGVGSGYSVSVNYPVYSLIVYPTFETSDSNVDASGSSSLFSLAAGQNKVINAGMASMNVTTTDDDPNGAIANNITLRDAMETGNNGNFGGPGGPNGPAVTFQWNVHTLYSSMMGTIGLDTDLPTITKSYDILGTGAGALTVEQTDPVYGIFGIAPGVTTTISGLTLTGGAYVGGSGGAVANSGIATLENDTISNNYAENNGGGVFNGSTAQMNIDGCEIYDNTDSNAGETGGGGGVANSGLLAIESSEVYSNTCNGRVGGGIASNGANSSLALYSTSVYLNNVPNGDGGGISNGKGTLKITGSSIYSNEAGTGNPLAGHGGGGGIINYSNGNASISNATISINNALYGGGIYNVSGTITLKGNCLAGW